MHTELVVECESFLKGTVGFFNRASREQYLQDFLKHQQRSQWHDFISNVTWYRYLWLSFWYPLGKLRQIAGVMAVRDAFAQTDSDCQQALTAALKTIDKQSKLGLLMVAAQQGAISPVSQSQQSLLTGVLSKMKISFTEWLMSFQRGHDLNEMDEHAELSVEDELTGIFRESCIALKNYGNRRYSKSILDSKVLWQTNLQKAQDLKLDVTDHCEMAWSEKQNQMPAIKKVIYFRLLQLELEGCIEVLRLDRSGYNAAKQVNGKSRDPLVCFAPHADNLLLYVKWGMALFGDGKGELSLIITSLFDKLLSVAQRDGAPSCVREWVGLLKEEQKKEDVFPNAIRLCVENESDDELRGAFKVFVQYQKDLNVSLTTRLTMHASERQIKTVYRRMLLTTRPDQLSSNTELDDMFKKMFTEITAKYKILIKNINDQRLDPHQACDGSSPMMLKAFEQQRMSPECEEDNEAQERLDCSPQQPTYNGQARGAPSSKSDHATPKQYRVEWSLNRLFGQSFIEGKPPDGMAANNNSRVY